MSFNLDASLLTSPTQNIVKTKYFPVEISCSSMLPSTTYSVYYDGILVNSFCKPFGKNLGDPIISDATGKLKLQFHMAIQYNQKYLIAPGTSTKSSNILQQNKILQFVSVNGASFLVHIPLVIKA